MKKLFLSIMILALLLGSCSKEKCEPIVGSTLFPVSFSALTKTLNMLKEENDFLRGAATVKKGDLNARLQIFHVKEPNRPIKN